MPLVEVLLSAGHQVQVLMRSPAADLAQVLFPEIDVVILKRNPFHGETKKMRQPFQGEFERVERFVPEIYVASSFQLNFFDEIFLKKRSANLRMVGFESLEDFWPSDTSVPPFELVKQFSTRVKVPTAMPEGLKSLRLAEAILGKEGVVASAPRGPTQASISAARTLLAEHGIKEREFVVVCAGSRPGLVMKDWGEKNWAALLKDIGSGHGRTFVFLGNPKESASIERLRASLPPSSKHVSLAVNPPPVAVSYALVSMASAYLGRDSGVMHLAAAAGIPILAVFAGGHWPRFLPQAKTGIVLTRKAPCRGCHFLCPFTEPWCATSVPVSAVAESWRRLESVSSLELVDLAAEEIWLEELSKIDVEAYVRKKMLASREAIAALQKKGLFERLWGALMSS